MNEERELEEKLREAACIGDEKGLASILEQGVDVNSQNSMNGWTPLHWAAKRGHASTVDILMKHGAKATIKNSSGEIPAELASDEKVRMKLGKTGDMNETAAPVKEEPSFTPNYLMHPPFPYTSVPPVPRTVEPPNLMPMKLTDSPLPPVPTQPPYSSASDPDELVIKIRIANCTDHDFIEVELDRKRLTYEHLMTTMCCELQVNRTHVLKIRKLPDTVVRKDKDVKRFRDFQELELVLTNKAISESSRNYNGTMSPRHVEVVY